MIYYTLLIIIYICFSFSKLSKYAVGQKRKIFTGFMLLPAFVITAFRDVSIGNDTYIYYYGFNKIAQTSTLSRAFEISRYEEGYVTLNYLFSHLGFSYYIMQICITLFIYVSIYNFIVKKSDNIAFSCFIFSALRMMFGPMNTVRMWLAIAILLYTIKYIENKKIIKFIFMIIMASFFHRTAIVFILLYPMCLIKDKLYYKIGIFIIAIIIEMIGINFFLYLTSKIGIYEGYLQSQYFVDINNTAVMLILIIDIIFLALFEIYKNKYLNIDYGNTKEKINIYYIAYAAMVLIVALDIIGLGNTIMGRISAYFQVFYLISIPHLIKKINGKNAFLLQIAIIVFLVLQFYVVMIYRPQWNGVTPYAFFKK